ncbi:MULTISPECIES: GPW/gp25 family protein [unclassified Phaeobacter]|uniref:GPW/gp25 family protein n=1 Tax=unclassified Phaeobacter TaxID=2621772 RepID=UPI003A8BD4B2
MSFAGMDRQTGRWLTGIAHLRQSVETILTTPIGSRVMRRDFGSRLPELVDKNITQSLRMQMFAATVEALRKWEPRLEVQRVFAEPSANAHNTVSLAVEGIYLPNGRPVTLEGIEL